MAATEGPVSTTARDELLARIPTASGAPREDLAATSPRFRLAWIVGRVELSGDVLPLSAAAREVFAEAVAAKKVALWHLVREKMIYGSGLEPEPSGLQALAAVHPLGVASLGRLLDLASLSAWIAAGREGASEADQALVMNARLMRWILHLLEGAGSEPAYLQDAVLGLRLPCFDGLPILVSDYVRDDESGGGTSIYRVRLGRPWADPRDGGLIKFFAPGSAGEIRIGMHADGLDATLEHAIGFAALDREAVQRLRGIELPA